MHHKLQEIAMEIAHQRQKLLQVVGDLSQQQLDFQPVLESWSIGEVLHHLFLIEMQITKTAARLLDKAQQLGLEPDPGADGSALHALDHLREVSQNKFKFAVMKIAKKVRCFHGFPAYLLIPQN